MKKLLSAVLACAMILTMVVPMTAFADGEVTISSSAETKMELENYTIVNGNQMTSANLKADGGSAQSGGGFLGANGSGLAPSVTATVTVEQTGYYDIEYTVTAKIPTTSTIEVYLGDTLIGTNSDANTQVFYSNLAGCSMNKFNKSGVLLTAGTYTFRLTVAGDAQASAGSADTTHRYAFDYIKFTPFVADEEINLDAKNTIEFEEYTTIAGNQATCRNDPTVTSGFSGDGYIGANGSTNTPSVSANISVEETGTYAIEYAVSPKSGSINEINIYLGDTLIGSNTETATKGEQLFYSNVGSGVNKYNKNVPLTAGIYELRVEILMDVSDGYGGYTHRWAMDYISFGPIEADATVNLTDVAIIELDDYDNRDGSVSNGNANGGDHVYANGTNNPLTISATVYVAESGTYDVEYISTPANSSVSTFEYYLGDTLLGANDDDCVAVDPSYIEGYGTGKYTKTVELTEGVYTLSVKVGGDGGWRFLYDYIKFSAHVEEVPRVDAFELAEGTATATVYYDAPVAGTVILALYNGNTFVGMGTYDASGETDITVSAANITSAVTKAKVFVWESLDFVLPLADEKIVLGN